MSDAPFLIAKGRCYVYLAFDVGLSINLDLAANELRAQSERPQVGKHRRQPQWFGYDPPPLRFTLPVTPVRLGAWETEANIEATVWDFGAISLAYRIALAERTALSDLVVLSELLDRSDDLEEEARKFIAGIAERLEVAIKRPKIQETVEDYFVYEIEPSAGSPPVDAFVASNSLVIAQILRAEHADLSNEMIEASLRHRCSYTKNDIVIIDWNGAIVYGTDNDDICAVLEFAQSQLLEMRLLDEQLDNDLDDAYPFTDRPGQGWAQTTITHLDRLKIDAALLYEGIKNASNLIGEQFLATVYRRVSERFDFAELDQSITRKLSVIDAIAEQVNNRRTVRQSQLLEIIIIVLILIEVLRAF